MWQPKPTSVNYSYMANGYMAKINKVDSNPACRLCYKFNETVFPIVSGFPVIAETKYIIRHDKLSQYTHSSVRTMVLKSRIHRRNSTRRMSQIMIEELHYGISESLQTGRFIQIKQTVMRDKKLTVK